MSASPIMTPCPRCQQEQAKVVGDQRAVCGLCSKALRRVYQFCWACQREWRTENYGNCCDLPGCALRAALLSGALVTDPASSVLGCPFFRACPSCKALLTHSGEGCSCVVCEECQTGFCFRCLRKNCDGYFTFDESEDDDDDDDYEDEAVHTDAGAGAGADERQDGRYHFLDDYDEPCTIVDNRKALEVLGL